ncbi:MAG: hypothetical protein Q9166_008094 [cf. Caloplaca sp. 2 TL-2023]
MTSTGANAAAIAAALNASGQPASHHNRQSWTLKGNSTVRGFETASKSGIVPIHNNEFADDDNVMQDGDAVTEGMPDDRVVIGSSKARIRRASEGAHLSKGEGKRTSGELRCEKCGKGMNQDDPLPPDTAKTVESDQSSASPDISTTSEVHDDYVSSAETTPPPVHERSYFQDSFSTVRDKRHSGTSSAFSRSYQSAPSNSFLASSIPSSSYGQHYPDQRRPSTSGVASAAVDEDEAGLAAAVQSLCSFGTPRTGPVHLPADVPPVPPLPAQYAGQSVNRLSANIMTPMPFELALPPVATQRTSNERGSRPVSGHKAYHNDEGDADQLAMHHHRNDDDEDGVFGRMDE